MEHQRAWLNPPWGQFSCFLVMELMINIETKRRAKLANILLVSNIQDILGKWTSRGLERRRWYIIGNEHHEKKGPVS